MQKKTIEKKIVFGTYLEYLPKYLLYILLSYLGNPTSHDPRQLYLPLLCYDFKSKVLPGVSTSV